MAKTKMSGRFRSACIEHIGAGFNVWRFDRDLAEYEVFCHDSASLAVTFSGADAKEIEVLLRLFKDGILTEQAFEESLAAALEMVVAGTPTSTL
jgi:hypothetical protein